MKWRARILQFPVVRIIVAAVPILAFSFAVQMAASAGLPGLIIALLSAGFPLLYAGYVRWVERRPVHELTRAGAIGEVARGIALGAGLFAATIGILSAIGAATIEPGDGWAAMVAGLGVATAAALSEEILLRAILFRIVEDSLGTWIALALSAALFGALHAFNPGATAVSTAAIALEAGILLAAAFVLTRRLWIVFGLHAAWNFTEGSVFGATVSGNASHGLFRTDLTGAPLVTGGEFGPEASVIAVAVCLAAGIVLLVCARGRFVRPYWRRSRAPAG